MARDHLLAFDQGTSSSRSVVVDGAGRMVAVAGREFKQHFPAPGLVEHDAMEIWESQLATMREVLSRGVVGPSDIAAIGVTNQRETIVLWDRLNGSPLCNAIVWQDRRTSREMAQLREKGVEQEVSSRSGLLLDPYFSASKLAWMLDHVPGARERAQRGELAAGTIDSWLIWKLTGGRSHVTDVSNASRTMLMNLGTLDWDEFLLGLFRIPRALLPAIVDSSGSCALTDKSVVGAELPIAGIAGDQQAALFGQCCHGAGMTKTTFGTGCFMLRCTGESIVRSSARLLSTVAWRIRGKEATYALEGSVFMGGATIQWLRDGLGIIKCASEVNELAGRVPDAGGVVLVPAFAGLGAPHWDPTARGTILGLTRASTAAHIARAALDGIAMQVAELHEAMRTGPSGERESAMRVDGGACASDLLMQLQADALGVPVERPAVLESTALGCAFLAGLAVGVWPDLGSIARLRKVDRVFMPQSTPQARGEARRRWSRAIDRAMNWEEA